MYLAKDLIYFYLFSDKITQLPQGGLYNGKGDHVALLAKALMSIINQLFELNMPIEANEELIKKSLERYNEPIKITDLSELDNMGFDEIYKCIYVGENVNNDKSLSDYIDINFYRHSNSIVQFDRDKVRKAVDKGKITIEMIIALIRSLPLEYML